MGGGWRRRGVRALVRGCVVSGLAISASGARSAEPPVLTLPIDCAVPIPCAVQTHVDLDPTPGRVSDPACGPLSYDGHQGTDYRIPNLAAMHAGVGVRAAAAGTVIAAQDGAPDRATPGGQPTAMMRAIPGGACGNGVALDHGGGWQTHYCHLRRGSVRVVTGQRVAAGTSLGLVGLSGATDYPHLEFQLRHRGLPVDPYSGRRPAEGCGRPWRGLWDASVPRRAVAYYRPVLFAVGFATTVPSLRELQNGAPAQPAASLGGDQPLSAWVHVLSLVVGDTVHLEVRGPDGVAPMVRQLGPLRANRSELLLHAGAQLPPGAHWPPGHYVAQATVRRGSRSLAQRRWIVRLE